MQSELAGRWWRQQMWSLVEHSGNLRGLLWCFGHTEEWKSLPAAPLGSRCVGRLQAQLRMFSRVQPWCTRLCVQKKRTFKSDKVILCECVRRGAPSVLFSSPYKAAFPDSAALSVRGAHTGPLELIQGLLVSGLRVSPRCLLLRGSSSPRRTDLADGAVRVLERRVLLGLLRRGCRESWDDFGKRLSLFSFERWSGQRGETSSHLPVMIQSGGCITSLPDVLISRDFTCARGRANCRWHAHTQTDGRTHMQFRPCDC